MDYKLVPVSMEDGKAIIDIFNHYVKNSFAAYPEDEVPYELFQLFLDMAHGYPFLVAKDCSGKVLGFGFLHPHDRMSIFSQTAEITYFIAPENTGQGIGSQILDNLLDWAREKGITSILASISSLNPGSLAFHKKNGFVECGRFVGIGRKKGQEFDVVWMQKIV
ncbi:MAG: N-acetyltransferase family protein [Methanotrichaceae archaeon]